MQRYIPDLASRSVPRYTSYPTAAEFRGDVGAAQQRDAIAAIAPGSPVSLYVHIPYCRQICWYCGCNTGPVGRGQRLTAYLAALEAEIAAVAPLLRGQVVTIHFGGGSPNALPPAGFAALVATLRANFGGAATATIAVELDPRDMDRAYAEALAAAGVTRVSLGVQTFAPRVQALINRIQPYEAVAQVVADLRAAGIAEINFDLMYGLPGQTLRDIGETLDLALGLSPSRVAMFGYAHMPRLLGRQRMIDTAALPDAAARFTQSVLAFDRLGQAGYVAIGFDHFARPTDSIAIAAEAGHLRRNFQGFTDEPADAIIGLGASAISQFDGLLVQNEKHVGDYRDLVGAGGLAGVRGIVRTADDQLRGTIIERLLCDGTVDVAAVAIAHGAKPCAFASALPALQQFGRLGVATLSGWRVSVPPDARAYARLVASAFDIYRQPDRQRFSQAI
ncbi:oxygen-independent coproporphyrinogen III oxidase [Sphingomonas abietis]|uniref:Coproporphyrinogen-III oxidase n=2 Tax=Sphingomonas abietis TaxID=3012344 RepID=A0ABY7NU05_9SPHN|nr:oxygen-independent coproporphyrinogen III oxidase [Sphingomonas abietis]